MANIDQAGITALRSTFAGVVLTPDDDGYDDARQVHNGLIDKRPAVIARCHGTADIVEALAFARETGLEISIRGGGHNVAGRAVTNGGVMIDLAPMKGIHIDPTRRTARAQGGVIWREFNREAAVHGLATTGGAVSTTGIAGLTLGGGLGWLMSKHGLAADNLIGAEVVTAAGEVLNVNAQEHPDLFWALRGGGGNFGVVASFEYQLHPVQMVVGGLIAHPLPVARDLLRFYRDFAQTVSDDLTVFAVLAHAPDGSGFPICAFVICHTGPTEQAMADIQPLLNFGEPIMTQVGPMPYPAMNAMLDDGYPRGGLNYWKSSFVQSLDDGLIDTAVNTFATCPSPITAVVLEHFHGAVTRVDPGATPVPHRQPGFNLVITGIWMDPSTTAQNISWVRSTYEALQPSFAAGRWLNYLADDEAGAAIQSAYGANYDRLADVKRRYDPDNLFRLNHNITPVGS